MADLERLFSPHRTTGYLNQERVGPCDLEQVPHQEFAWLTFDGDDPLLPRPEDGFTWPVQYDADIRDADRHHREGARPKLVVGFAGAVPVLNPHWDWCLVHHQVGGYACHDVRLCVVPLTPTPAFRAVMAEAAKRWRGSTLLPPADLDEILAWRARLRGVGADCRHTYHRMTEALYPIDATDEGLAAIAVDPPRVEDLIDRDAARLVSPFWAPCCAFVVAKNCD